MFIAVRRPGSPTLEGMYLWIWKGDPVAQIAVLDKTGHITIDWDPNDLDAVAAAREQIADLEAAGYSFWLTETEPADVAAAGRGHVLVKRITADVAAEVAQASAMNDRAALDERPEAPTPIGDGTRRRGRPPKAATPDAVAIRPMRAG